MQKQIRVMVVDDSAVVRQVVTAILEREPDISVIAAVSDPIFALERMQREWPDVITLDVEMPRMDGITFLKHIMNDRPTAVVVCSSLATEGAETTLQALAAGALSIITKPSLGLKNFLLDSSNDLVSAVRAAARANLRNVKPPATPRLPADIKLPLPATGLSSQAMLQTTEHIVAIGTSTGGTQALEALLPALPRTAPGILIVQHMPEKFTAAFAARLDKLCSMEVREASDGARVLPGRVLIAPGGRHMLLKRSGAQYIVAIRDGPPVNRHRPSVDVLFRSVAKFAGKNAMGIIMTGMGDDGARGLKEMRDAGARTLAQDEASCVVYGMPREAVKHGAAERILPLDSLATAILHGTAVRNCLQPPLTAFSGQ